MSNLNITKIRRDTYRLVLDFVTLVLVDTQDGTEVYGINFEGKPELVTTAPRDFLIVARELTDGCEPLDEWLVAQAEASEMALIEEEAKIEQDIEARYELWLETRYSDRIAAEPEWAR